MSDQSKLVRSGTRALTGLVITGIAAAGVLALSTVQIPEIAREPHAITVDTMLTGERSVVCSGGFAELGADPSRPDVALPVGAASVISEVASSKTLDGQDGATGGEVFSASIGEPLAAAQTQQLESATLTGGVASNCAEPVNEQWLLGGDSTLGRSTTLTIGNASEVPATVAITVFDENGEVAGFQTAGVIVSPNSQQVVSLNGYAPDRERLAVRVTSTGAPVTAVLGVAAVDGLNPVGAASVTRQLRAETHVVIPGIANFDDHQHDEAPGHGDEVDRFPVLVHALSTSDRDAAAQVVAIDDAGARTDLGTLELRAGAVASLLVPSWPERANAVVIESEVPVYAAAYGTSSAGPKRDFEWFTAAAPLPADTEISAPTAPGGRLVLVNLGASDAVVTFGDESREVTIPAGASVAVKAATNATFSSTQPVYAAVRIIDGAKLASYPILPPADQGGELTVYTR